MTYNNDQFQTYLNTAGKITVLTAFVGVIIFSLVFLLNIGAKEFKQATAQQVATTSVFVLNTPPSFTVEPYEDPGSSTSTPTNAGDVVTWKAVADDSNDEDWFLLICDGETASPTANNGAPPECGAGDTLIAISATTSDGAVASAATTTTAAMPETNEWYAWACDSVSNARCTSMYSQGANPGVASSSSPFNVNHRPTFTGYWNTSPADPGTTVTFYATSTDTDTDGGQDTITLFVCNTASFNSTSSLGCNGQELASSTSPVHPNASSTFTIATPYPDDDYFAYAFVVDNHGFEAVGGSQGVNEFLTVNNVAPTIAEGDINLNGGVDMTLVEGVETSGFTLSFNVTDNNSCEAVTGGTNDEFSTSSVSIYRSGITRAGCAASSTADYDPNNCYPSAVNSSTWDLQCAASSTTCGGTSDTQMTVECTFPLWYVADPTGVDASSTLYFDEDWRAAVELVDDDGATSTFVEGVTNSPNVNAVTAMNLLDVTIAYGPVEPGDDTGSTNASTTVESTGNTGLDNDIQGESMCGTYTTGNTCPNSATSTIPAAEQKFASSTFTFGTGGVRLSSTTPRLALLNIQKTTSTTTPNTGDTYWGIAVPATITLSGSYTGENTFTAQMSDPSFWE